MTSRLWPVRPPDPMAAKYSSMEGRLPTKPHNMRPMARMRGGHGVMAVMAHLLGLPFEAAIHSHFRHRRETSYNRVNLAAPVGNRVCGARGIRPPKQRVGQPDGRTPGALLGLTAHNGADGRVPAHLPGGHLEGRCRPYVVASMN